MKNKCILILLSVLTIGIFVIPMTAAASSDITGTWIMSVETAAGSGDATFVLTQKGEAVTGTYKGSMGKQAVTGTCKGDDVALQYTSEGMGQSMTVDYTGTCKGDVMTGTVVMGDFGEGTFTGKKQ